MSFNFSLFDSIRKTLLTRGVVHLPSCTVYKNWPTSKTPLGKVTTVAWAGKDTGMVAVGNEAGSVRLFEIKG